MVRGRFQDEKLIEKVGWPCLWYQNVLIPSMLDDGTIDWTDTTTDSRGYVEEEPEEISVLFHGHNGDNNFDMAGAWEGGRATGTIDANHYVADQERIIPKRHSFPYKIQIVRGASTTDTLLSPWLDEILIVRDSSTKFTKGTDYSLSNDATTGTSTITWLSGGNAPTAGDSYAVKALIFPVWRIKNPPMVRALSEEDQLPWKVDLIRDDVQVRGGQ